MSRINELRRINRISRFRDPEYWPYTSAGEPITNQRPLEEVSESFNDPLIPKPAHGVNVVTDFDNVAQQNQWAEQNVGSGDSTTFSWVADPVSGSARGTVARFTSSGADSLSRMYPVGSTIGGGTNVVGIKNGRVRFYYRRVISNGSIGIRFREVDANNYYELQIAVAHALMVVKKVVAGVTTSYHNQVVVNTAGRAELSTWFYVDFEWWEGTDQYGTRLYMTMTPQMGPVIRHIGGFEKATRYYIDESPSFSNNAAVTISIVAKGSGQPWWLDEITVERWA